MKKIKSTIMKRLLTFGFILFLTAFQLKAQEADSVAVKLSVEKFVTAFNSLQWESFRKSFSDNATIFFPEWELASRKSGINEIEKTWLELFPEFKDPNNTFKLNITPKDLRIQLLNQTAIVTFHLGDGQKHLARRTLVLVKIKDDWKIAHLHASVLFPEDK